MWYSILNSCYKFSFTKQWNLCYQHKATESRGQKDLQSSERGFAAFPGFTLKISKKLNLTLKR